MPQAAAVAADSIALWVNPRRRIGRVEPRVFGSFVENLHRCIYGGLYDPASPVSDEHGFRADVIDAARAMGVSNVRFPGGCFAPSYHWRDGVGPRSGRPLTRYRADGQWPASNDFGTDEFLEWCRLAGAEPYICVNMGSGTAEEAAAWVEYVNAPVGSRWSDLRARNGHPEPYDVRLWSLGNEIAGTWELGYTSTSAEYIARARDFALAMKRIDPAIELVVAGEHFPIDSPQRDWNRDVLEQLWEVADYISMHHYIGHDYKDEIVDRWREMGPGKVHRHLTEYMQLLDAAIDQLEQDIVLVGHLKESRKRIGIAIDEYNPWFRTDGINDDLQERFNLSDALLVAAYFNIFLRHADTVTLANMAQLVNTIPAMVVRSGGEGIYRQGTSWVQEMFLPHMAQDSVDAWVDGPVREGRYFPEVAHLDVSATVNSQRDAVTVSIVNRDTEAGHDVTVGALGYSVELASARYLGGVDIDSANDFAHPEVLSPRPLTVDGTLHVPPASLTVAHYRLR